MTFLPRMAVAVAAAALFPVIGAAQEPAPQAPVQGRGAVRAVPQRRALAERPQLSAQQHAQVRAFEEQHRAAAEAARRDLSELNRQLDEALTASQVDNAKVTQLRASIVQKEAALAEHRVDRLAKLSSILTAEQRQGLRGRGLARMFGAGGSAGGRGGVMARPRAPRSPRSAIGQRGAAPQQRLQAQRQLRERLQRRQPQREQVDAARRRAEIRRLEARLEALRRRDR